MKGSKQKTEIIPNTQCPVCCSKNIFFQLVQQDAPGTHSSGCFIGPFLFSEKRRQDVVTYALCNDCGNSWIAQNKDAEKRKKQNRGCLIALSVVILLFVLFILLIVLVTRS